MRSLAIVCALAAIAWANGRPPMTNGVFFRPGDTNAVNVATTFGLLVSRDGCQFNWICESDIGFGGMFDPVYAVTPAGSLLATTFQGLRTSRDNGCSFTTATAQLPPADPGNLSQRYIDALAVGPTGDVWVGTADSGSNNGVWHSTDDATTFTQSGSATLPGTMWINSIEVAPSNAQRIYVTAFQMGGGMVAPSAHWFRSDDTGASWIELASAPQPIVHAVATSPIDADIVFLLSPGPPSDQLYRSTDAGAHLSVVLSTTHPITGIVARDATRVVVATQYDGAYVSGDGGATFAPIASPQLACLGQRSDGVLFGCASNYAPDQMALARSDDNGTTWTRVMNFEYLAGPLDCPVGTAEHDVCDSQLWSSVAAQLGVVASTCAIGPAVDVPAGDATPAKHGCCETGDVSGALVLFVIIVLARCAHTTQRRRWHR